MRPKPSHLHYISQPIQSLLRRLQHSHSQHESAIDADPQGQAARVPSGSSPEGEDHQMANAGPHARSGSGQGHIQGNVRLGEGAGLDSGSIKTGSAYVSTPFQHHSHALHPLTR